MRIPLLLCIAFLFCGLLFSAERPAIGWGVVSTPSPDVYDKSGKRVASLKGGDLFDVIKEVSINKEPAYYITLRRDRKPSCILSAAHCRVFLELPDPEDPEAVAGVKQIGQMLSDYYATLALRDALYQRALARHRAGSPSEKLEKLREELRKVPATDRALEAAQKKASTNAELLRHQDERKTLRYRTTGLQQEIERLKSEAETWERAHPFNPAQLKKNAVWKRLTAHLEELKPKVAPYLPTEDQ